MPKYVAKEDVEKGLVDPTKPLEEQPQYKEKVEKEVQERQKQHEDKRPRVVRPKKERPPRNPRPKFNYNKDDITETTQPPEAPKKLLEKPNKEKYLQGLEKLKAQRNPLLEQKRALFDEQRRLIRDLTESKKTGRLAITQYSGAMKDKHIVVSQLSKEIRALDDVKKRVASEIDELQTRYNQLVKPNASENYSLEELHYRIQQKEHYLTTGDINKREEAKLYNEINELKRALQKARPSIEIESEVGKLKDQIDILYKELKSIKSELHVKITEKNKIQAQLEQLEKQKKGEQGQVAEQRSIDDIKKEYDDRIQAAEAKCVALEDKIDDYVDKYNRDLDNWEDQQDLLNYIDWVKDQIERVKHRREEEERRKKEKEDYEKRKLKEKEEYEKRKEERKKFEEQKKAREEERKLRIQKEREAYINRNPNHQEIDLCEGLISYCNNLRPNAFQLNEKRERAAGPIVFGKEWQKEIKGGAVVIASKKSNLDEQAPKKQNKQKKKEEKPQSQEFTHGIEALNQFQKLQLLPPNNINEIDSAIKLIQDKLAFYNNPTEEQRNAFKIKAAAEFDERNAPRDTRENKRGEYKEKNEEGSRVEEKEEKAEKPKRKEKKELSEQDFPGLG